MIILGITDGQTSGASIVKDGEILAAINEERLVRLKQARGFPRESIKAVMEIARVEPEDIDGVAVAQHNMEFRNEVRGVGKAGSRKGVTSATLITSSSISAPSLASWPRKFLL